MRDKEINKVFKQIFKEFVANMLNPCQTFVNDIEKCETYDDLKYLFEENADTIFKKLDGECKSCDDKSYEISELEDEVEELKCSIKYISSENDEIHKELNKGFVPISLDDEYKIEAFKSAKDKFSVSEIESLLN